MKMFTAERVALLLLALAIAVWACVVFFGKTREVVIPESDICTDRIPATIEVVDSAMAGKKYKPKKKGRAKKNNKKIKAKKQQQPARQRDHLREPVREE